MACMLVRRPWRIYALLISIYWDLNVEIKPNCLPKIKIGSQKNRLEMGLREIESIFNFWVKSQVSTFISP